MKITGLTRKTEQLFALGVGLYLSPLKEKVMTEEILAGELKEVL